MKRYKGFNTTIGLAIIIIASLLVFLLLFMSNKERNAIPVEPAPTLESLTNEEKENLKSFKTYDFKYSYTITAYGYVPKFVFKLAVPYTEENKQYISNLDYSLKPINQYKKEENLVSEFLLTNLNEGDSKTITLSGRAKVRTYNLITAKLLKLKQPQIKNKEEYLSRYLKEEKNIEVNSKLVQKVAAQINGETKEELVENIYDYVFNTVEYTQWVGKPSAELTLKSKRGKCLDLSLAMVALCRAKNIPARIISGNIAREKDQNHTWVQVYFDEYGWIDYDPTIQIAYKNHYHNGMLKKRTMVKQRPRLNYIWSFINSFTPWIINYDVEDADIDKINITSTTQIKEVI